MGGIFRKGSRLNYPAIFPFCPYNLWHYIIALWNNAEYQPGWTLKAVRNEWKSASAVQSWNSQRLFLIVPLPVLQHAWQLLDIFTWPWKSNKSVFCWPNPKEQIKHPVCQTCTAVATATESLANMPNTRCFTWGKWNWLEPMFNAWGWNQLFYCKAQ